MASGLKIGRFWQHKVLLLLFTASAVFSIFWLACSYFVPDSCPSAKVMVDTIGLRNGDLLFRNGYGAESRFVTGVSNGDYSHIALAYRGQDGWKAVHAVPGETESIRDVDFLKCEPIETFYQPERACSGAFARVDCTDSLAWQALSFALDKVKRRFSFDHSYTLDDSSQYYCTELIYRAYLQVGINLADERRHEMPMPGTDGLFIFPSDILASPFICKVRKLPVCQIGPTQ